MVRRNDSPLPDSVDNGCFVDSQGKCLADVDVVERFYQVIHGVIVDPELRYLVEIFALLIAGKG